MWELGWKLPMGRLHWCKFSVFFSWSGAIWSKCHIFDFLSYAYTNTATAGISHYPLSNTRATMKMVFGPRLVAMLGTDGCCGCVQMKSLFSDLLDLASQRNAIAEKSLRFQIAKYKIASCAAEIAENRQKIAETIAEQPKQPEHCAHSKHVRGYTVSTCKLCFSLCVCMLQTSSRPISRLLHCSWQSQKHQKMLVLTLWEQVNTSLPSTFQPNMKSLDWRKSKHRKHQVGGSQNKRHDKFIKH